MSRKSRVLWGFMWTIVWAGMFWGTDLLAFDPEEFQTSLIEQLELRPAQYLGVEGHGMDAKSIDQALSLFYHENSLQPFWVSTNGPGERANAER